MHNFSCPSRQASSPPHTPCSAVEPKPHAPWRQGRHSVAGLVRGEPEPEGAFCTRVHSLPSWLSKHSHGCAAVRVKAASPQWPSGNQSGLSRHESDSWTEVTSQTQGLDLSHNDLGDKSALTLGSAMTVSLPARISAYQDWGGFALVWRPNHLFSPSLIASNTALSAVHLLHSVTQTQCCWLSPPMTAGQHHLG